ncbi:MAG: cache domain-containing protein, partial [Acidimicrobiales bacterium]
MSQLTRRARGPSMRKMALLAVAAVVAVTALGASSVVLSTHQVSIQTDKRVQVAAAVSSVAIGRQTSSLVSLVQNYAERTTLVSDLAAGTSGSARLDSQLTGLVATGSGISTAFVAGLSGTVTNVQPPSPGVVGRNFAFRNWYKGLVSTGGPYVSTAYRTALAGHPLVITVADYIRGLGGSPVGILAGVFNLGSIHVLSTDLARAQGITLTVADQNGTVLSNGSHDGLVSLAGDPRIRAARAGRTGLVDYAPTLPGGGRGPTELSAYTPVAGTGLVVVASVPQQVAFAGLVHLRTTVLAITAVLAAILLAAVGLFIRSDRRRRSSELQAERQDRQVSWLLESTGDGFASMDDTGSITAWSAQSEALFGWTASEVLGR